MAINKEYGKALTSCFDFMRSAQRKFHYQTELEIDAELGGGYHPHIIRNWKRGLNIPDFSKTEKLVQYFFTRSQGKIDEALLAALLVYGGYSKDESERILGELYPHQTSTSDTAHPHESDVNDSERSSLPWPHILPPLSAHPIVGREALAGQLKERLLAHQRCALYGKPGVGKTTLALLLAHDPDIQRHFERVLWASLGRDGDILSQLVMWAEELGVPSPAPGTFSSHDRSGRDQSQKEAIRSMARALYKAISQKSILFIVDDVWTEADAKAFRVGGDNCAYLIATRQRKIAVGFARRAGAIDVRELTGCGEQILAHFIPDLMEVEPVRVTRLVQAVGELPLALVLIGKHLEQEVPTEQSDRLGQVLEKLRRRPEERLRLSQPQLRLAPHPSRPADVSLSLQTVIEISEEALDWEACRVFRILSVFSANPATFSEDAALKVSQTRVETLYTLCDHSLLESGGEKRYKLHQTLADYAESKLEDMAAYERMATYYLNYAEKHIRDYHKLNSETDNILKAISVIRERKLITLAMRGVNAFCQFLLDREMFDDVEDYLTAAQQIATDLEKQGVQGMILFQWSALTARLGRYDEAEAVVQRALEIADKIKDQWLEARCCNRMGNRRLWNGDTNKAREYYERCLAICNTFDKDAHVNDLVNTARANLGIVLSREQKYEEAREHLIKLETIFERPLDKADLYFELAIIEYYLGNLDAALERSREGKFILDELAVTRPFCSGEKLWNQLMKNIG